MNHGLSGVPIGSPCRVTRTAPSSWQTGDSARSQTVGRCTTAPPWTTLIAQSSVSRQPPHLRNFLRQLLRKLLRKLLRQLLLPLPLATPLLPRPSLRQLLLPFLLMQ